MPNNINIVISSDNNYAQHAGAMLQSLLVNCSNPQKLAIHLISSGINESNLAKLNHVCETFNAKLIHIEPNLAAFQSLPPLRYGIGMYQRLAMAELLAQDLKRAIYLDIDLLVLSDIEELWDQDLKDRPIAAVENFSPSAHRYLGKSRQDYFNSGVLLIDLVQWRKLSVLEQALIFLTQNAEKLLYPDQCTLNQVFYKRWLKLPAKWNRQADIYGVRKKYSQGCGYSCTELQTAIRKPAIVHFIGEDKPWTALCSDPFQKHYYYYLRQTPWGKDISHTQTTKVWLKNGKSLRSKLKQLTRYAQLDQSLWV